MWATMLSTSHLKYATRLAELGKRISCLPNPWQLACAQKELNMRIYWQFSLPRATASNFDSSQLAYTSTCDNMNARTLPISN